jgi:hypothetical protein
MDTDKVTIDKIKRAFKNHFIYKVQMVCDEEELKKLCNKIYRYVFPSAQERLDHGNHYKNVWIASYVKEIKESLNNARNNKLNATVAAICIRMQAKELDPDSLPVPGDLIKMMVCDFDITNDLWVDMYVWMHDTLLTGTAGMHAFPQSEAPFNCMHEWHITAEDGKVSSSRVQNASDYGLMGYVTHILHTFSADGIVMGLYYRR